MAGAQTNNRAELTAVLLAILEAQPSLALQLFTDSQYAIHSICHWAPLWANTGWSCANADILKDIARIISLRHAPISFIWVKGHSGNKANEEADTLAGRGALLPGPILTYVSCFPPAWPTTSGLPEAAANHPKVFTTLPIVPLPKIIPLASLPKPEYTGLEPLHLQTEWEKQDVRLKRLMTAKSQGDFWHEWKSIVDPKVRPSAISAHDLRQVFLARMNPSQLLPVEFDALRHSTNRDWLALLPPSTPDPSPEGFFSRAITISEIENVKLHIKTHTMHAARGADKVNYAHVMSIPNEDLRLMFQACVDATDAPVQWLTTILAAIGKRGKDLSDPESYRTIGLESCLVKFLTLLIDRRFRAWAETRGCLPPSQNGFRTKHRTSNNAFVLRSAIEKAASKGQLLYTCFIDLRNAFPSVDHCYVGMLFCSTDRSIFAQHVSQRAINARRAANATLCLESYIGHVPAWVLRTLYMTMVDPHLIFGCEVGLDVESTHILPLEKLQHTYLRRLLGLNKRSAISVLFTETGLWPIAYRRVQLALRYLAYILRDKPALPAAALEESFALANAGHASWFSDLFLVLHQLPVPVAMDLSIKPTSASTAELIAQVEKSLIQHLEASIAISDRLILLHERLEYAPDIHKMVHRTLAFRQYLHIRSYDHRRAITRLIVSDHPLAIEQLRRVPPARRVPRELRTCRFCLEEGAIESEVHVLLNCTDERMVDLRESFTCQAFALAPSLARQRNELTDLNFLRALLSRAVTLDLLGGFVHAIFQLCAQVPMVTPT